MFQLHTFYSGEKHNLHKIVWRQSGLFAYKLEIGYLH